MSMYPSQSTTINQYNSHQFQPQPPPSNQYNRSPIQQQPQQQQQQQQQPIIPPRQYQQPQNPHDPTTAVINKLKIQYTGLTPNSTTSPTDKIRLGSTQERVPFERKADLYAILVGLEHLEGAFLRDTIPATQYTLNCNKYLSQYRTWMDIHSGLITSLDGFVKESNLNCPAALNRIKAGLPATSIHGGGDKPSANVASQMLDIAEQFITTSDAIRISLSMPEPCLEIDGIYSNLSSLLDALASLPTLPSDHEIKMKIQHWVQFCNAKQQSFYQFTLEEHKQLAFDIEQAYAQYRKFVQQ